jgi:lysophospholipase L1-like esterase
MEQHFLDNSGKRPSHFKKTIMNVLILFFAMSVSLVLAEGILRIKNRSMKNYDIEMWKYSKELKRPSSDPILGHEHVESKSAVLQSVEIRLNNLGMRGDDIPPGPPDKRRILFLGSSMTLGWGVKEEDTVTQLLQRKFREHGEDVEVLNGGIGNYNTVRYVRLYFKKLQALDPTDIVIHYFLNDAEVLEAGGGNFLLRNSQLAVTLWIAATRAFGKIGEENLVEHYRKAYEEGSPGFIAMKQALKELSDYAHRHKPEIHLYLVMTPDIHNLEDYKLYDIHDIMKTISDQYGYTYIDLLPAFKGLSPRDVWAMPGDPHPNALGHKLMAETIYNALSQKQKILQRD